MSMKDMQPKATGERLSGFAHSEDDRDDQPSMPSHGGTVRPKGRRSEGSEKHRDSTASMPSAGGVLRNRGKLKAEQDDNRDDQHSMPNAGGMIRKK